MISFQKIYGLYGLEHHTVEINGDVTMETDGRTREYKATQSVDSGHCEMEFRDQSDKTHQKAQIRCNSNSTTV